MITKEMTIHQVLEKDENCAPILLEFGMHCLGCPSARRETLEHAAMVHGISIDELLDSLNAFFQAK